MSATTIPAIGDKFEYSVLASKADWRYKHSITEPGHQFIGGTLGGRECDPEGTYSCPMCYDQWEKRTSTVVSVDHYMDNSIEVTLADGARREVVAPHGDRCY